MKGAVPVILVVGVAALVGCGGSDDGSASQAEIQQAREQGAAKARQQAKLRRLERQVQQIKKGQKKPSTTNGGAPTSSTSAGSSSCGDDLSVGPATTCGFGTNVRSDYYNEIGAGAGTVVSYSPTTGETYTMTCSSGAPHVCTGGNNASVYFP